MSKSAIFPNIGMVAYVIPILYNSLLNKKYILLHLDTIMSVFFQFHQ